MAVFLRFIESQNVSRELTELRRLLSRATDNLNCVIGGVRLCSASFLASRSIEAPDSSRRQLAYCGKSDSSTRPLSRRPIGAIYHDVGHLSMQGLREDVEAILGS